MGSVGAALTAHALDYRPFFADDSFISLRYAERFAQGQGLTWTDGERVEGYSNLLWVLLLAGARLVTSDLVAAARALGLLGALATVAAVLAAQPRERPLDLAPTTAAASCLAASGAMAAWAVGGLEQPLLVALLAWGVVLTLPLLETDELGWRSAWLPGLLLGLACLTRPDAPLLVAGIAGGLALGRKERRWHAVALLGAIPVALVLGQLAFRLLYYDAWLPNTYYAKLALGEARLSSGLRYAAEAALPHGGLLALVALAAVAAVRERERRGRIVLFALPAVLWLGYVIAIGGDTFPQRRLLLPFIVLCALLVAEGARWVFDHTSARPFRTLFVLSAGVALFAYEQRRDVEALRAKADVWNWRGKPLGIFLRRAFGAKQPLLAVDAAGALPYYARTPALDMLGLTDRYLATHRPESFGQGLAGHELGDGRYVLARKPDLIVFHDMDTGSRPKWKSGREMIASKGFRSLYQPVVFEVEGERAFGMWVRKKEDGKLGIERASGRVRVPGYLAGGPNSGSRLDREGRVVRAITRSAPAVMRPLPLTPGRWRLVVGSNGALNVSVTRLDVPGAVLARGRPPVELEVTGDRDAPLRVALRPAYPDDTVELVEVRFDAI